MIIVFSAYSPWDILGLYSGINIADTYLTDGEFVEIQGQIYHKEIKNDKCIYYVKCSTVSTDSGTLNNISLILNLNSDLIPNKSVIKTKGKVHSFNIARNDGEFDMKRYYNSLGLVCQIDEAKEIDWQCNVLFRNDFLYRFNKAVSNVYTRELPAEEAGFLSSVALGNRMNLDNMLKEIFQSAGVAHVLAVSGLHVSVVCMGIYSILKKRGVSFLGAAICSGIVALCYCSLTGASISSIRAVGMFVIYLGSQVLGRAYDMSTALALMGDIIVFTNPLLIINSSFIFSFTAIAVIILIAKPLTADYMNYCKLRALSKIPVKGFESQYEKSLPRKLVEYLVSSLIFSGSLTIGMLPLVGNMFHETPTMGVLINLLILPLMPALLALGLIGGVLGLLWAPVGAVILYICHIIIFFFEMVADVFSGFDFSLIWTGYHSGFRIVTFYVLVLSVIHFIRLKNVDDDINTEIRLFFRKSRHRLCFKLASILLVSLLIIIPEKRPFEIDILDVGQGDGIFISSGDGASFFMDGGSTTKNKLAEYTLEPFLKYKGVKHIDYWFLSHMDLDHVSGLIDLLAVGYKVDHIVISEKIPGGHEILDIIDGMDLNEENYEIIFGADSVGFNGWSKGKDGNGNSGVKNGAGNDGNGSSGVKNGAGNDCNGSSSFNNLGRKSVQENERFKNAMSDFTGGKNLGKLLYLARLNDSKIIFMNQGDVCGTKKLTFKCLFPGPDATEEDINDLSMTLLMEYDKDGNGKCDYSAFFGGDLGAAGEHEIAEKGLVGHVDLLKVSHHGSKYSSDELFLSVTSPDTAVISCAKRNQYGHPSKEAVDRLEATAGELFYTMKSGRVRVDTDVVDLFIAPEDEL